GFSLRVSGLRRFTISLPDFAPDDIAFPAAALRFRYLALIWGLFEDCAVGTLHVSLALETRPQDYGKTCFCHLGTRPDSPRPVNSQSASSARLQLPPPARQLAGGSKRLRCLRRCARPGPAHTA